MSERSNIKFYGIHDMSSGYYLKETEAVFQNWDNYISSTDINTMLELYNIKKFFDVGARLDHWDDEQYGAYHEKSRLIPRILGVFCTTISDDNLIQLYQSTDCNYWDDFWELICVYKVYRRISPAILEKLLETGEHIVWQILYQNELSAAFGEVIANHLLHNSGTAPHLVSHYLTLHGRDDPSLSFPREFTQSMRDKVLAEFVNRDDANINTLQLVAQAQSSGVFPLSDRLRRDAKKKMKALQEKLFANSPGMTYGANVTFKSIPNGSVEMSYDRGVISCAYSREWIEENQDYTEKTRSKYQTLPELLLSEKMKKEDFRDYQRKSLDWLLEHSDLAISEDGYITIEEKRVSVLKDLFVSEVICPIYYGSELREQVDILAASGDLRYKGTLFSGPEQDYLNFMLNKAEFSNGFDLRNRYIHDTCTLNEEMQQQDYLELLKIMALIIIKINEEFCKKTKIGTD